MSETRDRVRKALDAHAAGKPLKLTAEDVRWLLWQHPEEQIERAVRDLRDAADQAESAAADAASAAAVLLGVDDDDGYGGGASDPTDLKYAVIRWHDENHDEAMRFCTEPCRVADGFVGVSV